MTATLNEDPDLCYICHQQPAVYLYGGMCGDCHSRTVWQLPLREEP